MREKHMVLSSVEPLAAELCSHTVDPRGEQLLFVPPDNKEAPIQFSNNGTQHVQLLRQRLSCQAADSREHFLLCSWWRRQGASQDTLFHTYISLFHCCCMTPSQVYPANNSMQDASVPRLHFNTNCRCIFSTYLSFSSLNSKMLSFLNAWSRNLPKMHYTPASCTKRNVTFFFLFTQGPRVKRCANKLALKKQGKRTNKIPVVSVAYFQ